MPWEGRWEPTGVVSHRQFSLNPRNPTMAVYLCGWTALQWILYMFSLRSPAPYCHRGKQLLWPEHGRASQHPSEHSGSWGDLIYHYYYYHYIDVGGLVDFFGFGPFADHNSICRVPNLWLSHRHLCGSAKTSAEHDCYRSNHRTERIVFC